MLLVMLAKGISVLKSNFFRVAGVGLAVTLSVYLGSVNVAAAATGSDKLERGPKVGETIPHQLKATDHRGQSADFSSVAGKKGLILLFTRSLDW